MRLELFAPVLLCVMLAGSAMSFPQHNVKSPKPSITAVGCCATGECCCPGKGVCCAEPKESSGAMSCCEEPEAATASFTNMVKTESCCVTGNCCCPGQGSCCANAQAEGN